MSSSSSESSAGSDETTWRYFVVCEEQLLLSVIPAYIAAEVKRSIMLKMADACQSSTKRSRQRFHELYVQRHNNVR
ncbi:hypothetical protein HPB47_009034 [Ixodes persulcatus]|uniref:Uncharacterized protein n=1 Tax=Ixodes persulcatus TaxID=34615 RepID=A0AC60P3D6_IXOPE|nr:hypothetical protein HPB47_009034 [Ixodes persulcatus]